MKDYRDDPQVRIAIALETLAGCTGWVDPTTGQRQHDGPSCPVHESGDPDFGEGDTDTEEDRRFAAKLDAS